MFNREAPCPMDATPFTWTGRVDSPEPERVHQYVTPLHALTSVPPGSITLLGFACDSGVKRNHGRPGAHLGPRAIREALANLCVPDGFTRPLCDAGDVSCQDDDLEHAQQELAKRITALRRGSSIPFILGGGHETAFATFQGIFPELGSKRLGIINFDAHYDLRPLPRSGQGTSGTPFRQIALYCEQRGYPFDYTCIGLLQASNTASLRRYAEEKNLTEISAEEIHLAGLTNAHLAIANLLDRCEVIYLSLCLDVFAATYAPGVSAPSALGLTPWQVIPLLRKVVASGKVIAMDLVELAPPLDENQRTAKLAAALALELMVGLGRLGYWGEK